MATGDVHGISRWEDDDPVASLDAQITVLRAARQDTRREIPKAEELAVRAMAVGSSAAHNEACSVVAELRQAAHDFSVEIDELQAERRQLLPTQRCPGSTS